MTLQLCLVVCLCTLSSICISAVTAESGVIATTTLSGPATQADANSFANQISSATGITADKFYDVEISGTTMNVYFAKGYDARESEMWKAVNTYANIVNKNGLPLQTSQGTTVKAVQVTSTKLITLCAAQICPAKLTQGPNSGSNSNSPGSTGGTTTITMTTSGGAASVSQSAVQSLLKIPSADVTSINPGSNSIVVNAQEGSPNNIYIQGTCEELASRANLNQLLIGSTQVTQVKCVKSDGSLIQVDQKQNCTPPTDAQANAQFAACCQDQLPAACVPVCAYNADPNELGKAFDLSNGYCGITKLSKYLGCASNGNDNTGCCQSNGVTQSQCQTFCSASPNLGTLNPGQIVCANEIQQIMGCHRKGLNQC